MEAAAGLSAAKRKFFGRLLPTHGCWSAYIASDWGDHGARLGAQVFDFSARRRNLAIFSLSHDIPAFSVMAAAYLFEGHAWLAQPNTVFVCVVDPGVGSSRKAIAVRAGNGSYFVGPHNGVFDLALRCLSALYGIDEAVEIYPEGRQVIGVWQGGVKCVDGDRLFSAAAGAIIAHRGIPPELGRQLAPEEFGEALEWEVAYRQNGIVSGKIEYADNYGNLSTNIPLELLADANGTAPHSLKIKGMQSGFKITLPLTDHFAAVERWKPLALQQGNSFLHIAVREGSAATNLGFAIGEKIRVGIIGEK
jgi:S-adenosylmethionine hydrolase